MFEKSKERKEKTGKESYWDRFLKRIVRDGAKFDPRRVAIRIAGIYILLGVLWILLSDKILELIVFDKQTMIYIGMIKGWIYVFLTGLVILGLIYSVLKKIKADQQKILESYRELTDGEEKLHHMAYHDLLTGLPGRLALYENLSAVLARNIDTRKALLFVDLDNFKFINDSMGHSFGDQLLKKSGERLAQILKDNGTVYKLGGDEFVIVTGDVRKQEDAESLADQILAAFQEPFGLGESMLYIKISIGISLYPEHGKDIDELLKCADIAMYGAKRSGRNCRVVYSQPMNDMIAERVLIEKHLHMALEKDEFELHYQPQLDIKENRVTGLEALIRWNSHELGPVPPMKFIRIAEETQLIMPIGEWVLKKACSFIKTLHSQGHTNITLSVNISILQLLQNNFTHMVLGVLEFYGLNPQCLELEITESVLMESYEAIEDRVKYLCSKGIKIALDDFGKGYSSLSYLKQLPISTLKIDKSFIDGISSESESESLTGQIVMMGRNMGLSVIAEGVETQEQVNYLIRHKCHKIQGYLFSKPLPERDAENLVIRGAGLESRKI